MKSWDIVRYICGASQLEYLLTVSISLERKLTAQRTRFGSSELNYNILSAAAGSTRSSNATLMFDDCSLINIFLFLSCEAAASTNRNLPDSLTRQLAFLNQNQPVSTWINPYQPVSTKINQNQHKSTWINPNQPESTQIYPHHPVSTHFNKWILTFQ